MTKSAGAPLTDQLDDIAQLVATGPVSLGAYTQAELAVVLGLAPALMGDGADVLAEAVRSLAARGVLFRRPGEQTVEVTGDLGLVAALVAVRLGTLDIRRGHDGPPGQPWRWLISLFPNGVVGVDRVDALGMHRLSLHSAQGAAKVLASKMIDGKAQVPADLAHPVPVSDADLRSVTEQAPQRWQLIYRVPRDDGTTLVVDAVLLRTGETRVDLVTRTPSGEGYQRTAADEETVRSYIVGLTALR